MLAEHNLNIDDQFPKGMELVAKEHLRHPGEHERHTRVASRRASFQLAGGRSDRAEAEPVYRTVASQIEGLVMRLILDLRSNP